ncbi:MAG: 16S rRNA (cytosine(967)-C(5))-methyltransferase RsmB [Erysipelotrichaceae bacterium]
MNTRKLTYEILKKIIIDKQYANLLMRQYKKDEIKPIVTQVVYGVLRNWDLLSLQWSTYATKTKMRTRILFNMAAYEFYFLNEEKYAVVNETVGLAQKEEKSFVNAVLRRMVEQEMVYSEDDAINYSIPKWIMNLWKAHYGEETAKQIAKQSIETPVVYYQLNTLVSSKQQMEKIGAKFINDTSFTFYDSLIQSDLMKQGCFQIQDFGASLIVEHLALNSGLKVLDLCAAPGGKTAQIAMKMKDDGEIIACDLHPHRVALIEEKMKTLHINSVCAKVMDGTCLNDAWLEHFDRILLDVPCSGLGVLSRRPDIKFHTSAENIDEIIQIQAQLLKTSVHYLKKEGIMVYSTCTLNKKENEKQIQQFLLQHPEMKLLHEETIWPHESLSDGFYLAKMIKQ